MKSCKSLMLLVFLFSFLQVISQEKLVVAGSGNSAIMIVDRDTKNIEWRHELEKGEECNSVAVTPVGDILYSYKNGAKLIDREHRVIWDYKVPDDAELQSAALLKDGGFLLGICGHPAKIIELDKNGRECNRIEMNLEVESPHGQFRQIFQLRNKNYLLPVLGNKKVMEIDRFGNIIYEFVSPEGAFSALELKNGNLLLSCGDGHFFTIVDRKTGKEIKRVTSDNIKGAKFLFVAQITETRRGNLLICNWDGHSGNGGYDEPQLIEMDKDGRVVWSLNDKKNVGKISAVYIMND